jgi:hypothetical protein
MDSPASLNNVVKDKKGLGCVAVTSLIILSVLISVAVTVWVLNVYLFPKRFEPVVLNVSEQRVLDHKLDAFEHPSAPELSPEKGSSSSTALQAIPYSEQGADRLLTLTERELNALLAKNTELANKLAIDLSDDLLSARLRIPMDEDFPFFGGKLLKARAGIEFRYAQEKPVLVLKGVSVMGVPVPNAWMGGLKKVDLVAYFGQSDGFWKSLSEGVKHVKVVEGAVQIELKE